LQYRGVVVALAFTRQTVAIGTPTLAADVNPLLGVVLEMTATFFSFSSCTAPSSTVAHRRRSIRSPSA
jgi:hypothetical protein